MAMGITKDKVIEASVPFQRKNQVECSRNTPLLNAQSKGLIVDDESASTSKGRSENVVILD
jgi:hypothetical protein